MKNTIRMDRRGMLGLLAGFPLIGFSHGLLARQGAATADELGQVATGTRYAVATVNRYATEAALKTFEEGGNAADAAVAAALMLSVVDGYNSGIGGGCFILARRADGRMLAIDGRETAPGMATAKMFFRNGKADPSLSQTGALASGVPGAVAAYGRLSSEIGTGRWKNAAGKAAERASLGFEISEGYASRLQSAAGDLIKFGGSRDIFFDDDGQLLQAGAVLVQEDLADTFEALATEGPRTFYEGRTAELVEAWMLTNGGLLRREDFASYRTRDRDPVECDFRGHQILGFPPPSSGGVHVAQILRMLERFDLKPLYESQPAKYYHVVAEAMRLAFADRAEFLGDPSFAEVPLGLVDDTYLSARSDLIRLDKRIPIVSAGAPPGIGRDLFGRLPRHTTHLTTADADGNWVAITATVNTTFGSKVVIPGTGIVMNNQMDDFSIAPGVPNAFGLVGSDANAPAPGKRPLSSMSPTIVMKEGVPVLTCGAAGGPRIISATTQILLNCLALEMPVDAAMQAARIHHQWRPETLYVENGLPERITDALTAMGYEIRRSGALATAQALAQGGAGELIAVGESRLPGVAGAI